MHIVSISVFLFNLLSAQFALPTFQGVHKPAATASSTSGNIPVVAGGYHFTVAILEDGSIKAWGRNNYGQLGQGNTNSLGDESNEMGDNLAAVDLGSGRTAKSVAAGLYHTVALLDNGSVKAWGDNSYGQLGQGNTQHIGDESNEMGDNLVAVDLGSGRTATAIAAGFYHTAALLDNGTVKVWGYGRYGQLGQGNSNYIGDGSNEMGDNLAAVDLGSGRTATAISAAGYQTAALLDDGTVKVWGYGWYGQLGQGNTQNIGDGSNEMGDNLAAVDLGSGRTATAICVYGYSVAALLDNGTVKAWGRGSSGKLGQGSTSHIGQGSNQMGDNLTAINLGSGRTATVIGGNYLSLYVILDNGISIAFGDNGYGQLGQGNINDIGDASNEMGDNLAAIDLGSGRTAKSLHAGIFHGIAVLDNGTVKAWGYNGYGLLGQGSTFNLGDGANEMGDNLPSIDLSSSSDKVLD